MYKSKLLKSAAPDPHVLNDTDESPDSDQQAVSPAIEEARDVAESQGFKWVGLFNADEDGGVYKLTKPTRGMSPDQLFLTETGDGFQFYFEGDTYKGAEGAGLEELESALHPAAEPEEEEVYDDGPDAEYVQKCVEWVWDRVENGRLDISDAYYEGGRDGVVDAVGDFVRQKFQDRELAQAINAGLFEQYIQEMPEEAEQEEAAPTEEPTSLTPEEQQEIISSAKDLWQSIGSDVMQAREYGLDNQRNSIPRKELIEVVLDADHLSQAMSPELYAKFDALPDAQKFWLMDKAFPSGSYGR